MTRLLFQIHKKIISPTRYKFPKGCNMSCSCICFLEGLPTITSIVEGFGGVPSYGDNLYRSVKEYWLWNSFYSVHIFSCGYRELHADKKMFGWPHIEPKIILIKGNFEQKIFYDFDIL